MTLFDLIEEAQEKTHAGELEILALVRAAWPAHEQFTPTQAALVVNHIQRQEVEQ
jgi:hypothetical protein